MISGKMVQLTICWSSNRWQFTDNVSNLAILNATVSYRLFFYKFIIQNYILVVISGKKRKEKKGLDWMVLLFGCL